MSDFLSALRSGRNIPEDLDQNDLVLNRLFAEYGAVLAARGVVVPTVVVFKNEEEVSAFQAKAGSVREAVSGISVELQAVPMKALREAVGDADQQGLKITPRGTDAAKRSYQDTVELWASRVKPGLIHWMSEGRITDADVQRIEGLSPYEQVPEIFELEEQGIYFAKDLSKSIIYSVAPPGSSQHLSMLALDVAEHDSAQVRSILAKHGWFQTVVSDLPHFTYLGALETELPELGLKKAFSSNRTFWMPEV